MVLKTSNIIPVFENEDKQDYNNYHTNVTNFCFIMETSVSLKLSSMLTLNTKWDHTVVADTMILKVVN